MIVKPILPEHESEFLRLSKAFYGSGATKRAYDRRMSRKTFDHVVSFHENLWGYLIEDSASGKNAGYCLVTSYWCNEEGGNVLILDELYIDPAFRHHGYGSSIIEWLEREFADKAVSITLEVLSTNLVAKDLYRKEGFEEDGFVTMTKNLEPI